MNCFISRRFLVQTPKAVHAAFPSPNPPASCDVAKRLECGVSRRFSLPNSQGARALQTHPQRPKRRDTPHSKRFALFGCGLAALCCIADFQSANVAATVAAGSVGGIPRLEALNSLSASRWYATGFI